MSEYELKHALRRRLLPIVLCLLAVSLCLIYAKMRQQFSPWWRENGGGIPYVMFWITLWYAIWPDRKWINAFCFTCVSITCGLEFAQLWNPEPLASFRKTTLGAAWLGAGFDWQDIPPYFIGGFLCGGLLRLVPSRKTARHQPLIGEDLIP